ncbi:type I polyketide synthase [Accumulibacter sp.]|uniref:type I polyketide synthase n=1 Tax=Accumulibacter sp. TaxID=2053492 RepID=UPI002631E312|nr:type I polyketide synthase [Accumulibacter sp.]
MASSPVAIVGIAFRFPGDLSDEHGLWNALKEKQDLVGQIPSDRWATSELQHGKRSEPGRSITFSAGVLSRIDEFDAGFFGISPREAAWLDPQQRLLLELSWEVMENAGIPPSSMAGSDCAVYVGISSLDYGTRGLDDLASMTSHSMTGNTLSIAANRLSYIFDLHGPSLAVDTACSSSLVALHHACNSLHAGEASTALVGGINLLLHPYPFVGFTKASMLSADGRCKAFDASGDGYVRAEGGAVLLLKPLHKALADGDDIQAVILASGVNADGARKTGITIPSREGQAELMRSVLARSGLSAHDIDFVEAHGTGTAVGDPVEAAAIGTVYGCGRTRPLPIGSVKANLGHLEAASGVAGLVKAVLALKNRALPPALHLTTPNPHVDFHGLNLELVTKYRELARQDDKPLVAGVNSFGFGGANAHVLLREFCPPVTEAFAGYEAPLPPLFLSARSDAALRALAKRYSAVLSDKLPQDYYDIAHSAAYRRDRMEKRLALQVDSPDQASDLLRQYALGGAPSGIIVEDGLPQNGGVAFIYSGNGSQWLGMGRALMKESPRFSELLAQLDAATRPHTGFSLLKELQADEESAQLDDTVVAQPLLFALQVAVTTLLRENGVEPDAVAGHSVGEIAAAWAAGVLDLAQAIHVIVARSAAQGETRGPGRMAAVALSEAAAQATLAELGDELEVVIAGINSPNNVTLSGSLADLKRVQAQLEPKGVFFQLLDLDYAFHSGQMDPVEAVLIESLAGLAPSPTDKVAFISTVTGDELDGAALNAHYWWRNVREPVRFAAAVTKLVDLGCRVFIEIGPHAILQRYIGDCIAATDVQGRVLSTLRKDADGLARIVDATLRAHLLADNPDFTIFFPAPGRRVRLPNYPWQRERHWHPRTSESLASFERHRLHPLLGWLLPDAEAAWENTLDSVVLPWLADHKVGGAVVFPGSAYTEMALAAAREWLGGDRLALEELDIVSPMVFDGEHARTLRFTLNPRDGSFQIRSRQRLSTDEWTLHAAGRVLEATDRLPVARIEPLPESAAKIHHESHYRLAASLGLDYGPAFQGLAEASVAEDRLEAVLDLPGNLEADNAYLIHPAVLDICYQSLVGFFQNDIESGRGVALLPVKTGRLDFYRDGVVTRFRARLRRRSERSVLADFELLDGAGDMVASATGCRFRAAPLRRREQAKVSGWRIVPWLRPHPVDGLTTELPSSKELVEGMRTSLAGMEAQRGFWFKESLPLLEALTLSFSREAFLSLADQDDDGLQHLMESRSPYVRWLASLLRRESLVREQDGGWQLATTSELPAPEEIWQTLLRESPACLPQLTLLGRVGHHLPELLTGRTDGREFQRSLCRSFAAETLYAEDPAYLGTRLAIENALRHLASTLPEHRQLRVLDIAAGPCDLPRSLFDALPEDRLDYVVAFADEDTCQCQQKEYQDFPNVSVASLSHADWTLAAERPLPEVFDVVSLRHVVHRADSPRAALARARSWLASGGVLLLAERHPDWSADFLEGLDPAWWHEATGDESGSMDVPVSSLVTPEAWQQALRAEGFEGVELFSEPVADGLAEGAYLLLAKRSTDDEIALPVPEPQAWLLLADDASSCLADHLRIRLESQGQRAIVAPRMQGMDLSGVQHLVHLPGWDSTPEDAATVLSSLLYDVQTLAARLGKATHLWIVTRGGALASGSTPAWASSPAQAALWGFGRVVMNEYPALDCTLIDLVCDPDAQETLVRLENELLRADGANEIVLADRGRYTLAMREAVAMSNTMDSSAARFRLDFRMPGQLRNLLWLPEIERSLRDGEIEVRTQAAGLNFRDVMYVMGLLPEEAVEKGFAGASLGLEFSGIVTRIGPRVSDFQAGDAVVGFGPSCFASHVVTLASAVVPIPENWTFEAAASVPTVFFTVYYALRHLADLQPGERVLIHGAAGGVGIAAIQLARHLGAEIFATAGSDEKRCFVRLLGADHVFDSRNLAFADDILAATDGEGVDVVLNSLAGEAIRRNLTVLKPFGRFLELGKRDFYENTPIGLRLFKDNISYFGIDADQLLTGRPQLAARLFREVMALFRDGALSPLPYRTFTAERVADAFRVMQQARHIGKVIVSLADARPQIQRPAATPQCARFDKVSSWLITGGLAGFGLESARWLAAHGVGNLVLVGRRGMETPGAKEAIEELVAHGVNVTAISCDITVADELAAVVGRVQKTMPSLKGILHSATVIEDRLIANLDAPSVEAVLRPKLIGAWNLHQATLDLSLDHFVLYSSITTALGNPGQASYVAANAALEGLAEMRRHKGLPATCVGWGPIGDVGYLTRNAAVKDSLGQRLGKPPIDAAHALARLGDVLAEGGRSLAIANFDWNVLSRVLPSAASTRFAILSRNLKDTGPSDDEIDFRALIVGKKVEEIADIVRDLVTQEVAQVLSIGADRIDQNRALHDLGLDSLMAVELAMGLESRLGIQLPVMMLNESPTVEKVSARIVDKLIGGTEAAEQDATGALVESLTRRHGEEVSREEVEGMAEDARRLAQRGARLTA